MSFSNKTMRQPVKDKPHIAKIDGYWRVCAAPRKYRSDDPVLKRYRAAHNAVGIKNNTGTWPSNAPA